MAVYFYPVCPQTPIDGACPVDLVFLEHSNSILTYSDFLEALPAIFGVLFLALGIRYVVRLIWNNR